MKCCGKLIHRQVLQRPRFLSQLEISPHRYQHGIGIAESTHAVRVDVVLRLLCLGQLTEEV